MKNIFLIMVVFIFASFFTACGGYLPSAPTNWNANPTEMHVWDPPDKETLAKRRENQQYLDKLTSEIERLFINQASVSAQEETMDGLIRKADSNIRNSDSEFSSRINKEIARNQKMKEDLQNTRVKYDEQKERLRLLSEVKPPVIFSSENYKLAMKAFSDGKYKASLKLFNGLIKQNPPNFLEDNIHFGIGSSFYRLKKFSNAKKYFQKVVDDYPMGDKLFNSYVMLGVIHNLQGEKSRALFLLDQALNSNPPERMKPLIKRLVANIGEDTGHASN